MPALLGGPWSGARSLTSHSRLHLCAAWKLQGLAKGGGRLGQVYQPSGAESYSEPDLKRWGAGTLGLGRGGAAGEGVEANDRTV